MDLHPSAPAPPRRPPGYWPLSMLLIVVIMLATGLLALYLAPSLAEHWRRVEDQSAAEAAYLKRQAELKAESEAAAGALNQLDARFRLVSLGFREVARKVAPVVVHITNEVEAGGTGRTFHDYNSNRTYQEKAEGSGLLVKPGLVLTNHHVVRDAGRLRLTFASGRWLTVEPSAVSADPLTDLAVVRLPLDRAVQYKNEYEVNAEFADSDKDVQVGDWVLAVGSPFGLRQTVTGGIVSAKGRVELGILDQVELLQTDVAINPGNSGGPLFDQFGRVAGINVAIATSTGRNQGVGFAIPANTAREVLELLESQGEVTRGFLGVRMQEVPVGLERRLGVAETGGVVVTEVGPNTPADLVGMRRWDVIVRYDGEPVGNAATAVAQLRQKIARTQPGTTVPIELRRNDTRLVVNVTITKRKS